MKRIKKSFRRVGESGLRRSRGASFALVIAGAFLLLVVGVAAFQLAMYLGGSRELRHSVDAAVLNVSKRATENKVLCGVGTGYDDVADSTGMVGLSNINRVWGKAYLINANEDSMVKGGYGSGASSANASAAFLGAQQLNDNLFNMLTSKASNDAHFTQIASNKPTRLLQGGNQVYTDKSSSWAYGWVYRGEESNIAVDTGAIPTGITPQYLVQNQVTYLQGFNPMQVNGKYICFTTFHANEPPHLITDTAFNQAKAAIPNTVNPIPNTFQEAGQIKNTQIPLTARANAVANPMRGFNLAIPHAYVTIQINNGVSWLVQGNLYATDVYYPNEGTVWKVKNYQIKKPGNGIENGYVSLGNEYSPANVYYAINNALPGDHSIVFTTLLQRIKQFCPNYTNAQLQTLLSGMPYNNGDTTWYIYPTYTQPDLSDPTVHIVAATGQLPSWFIPASPDGGAKQIMVEAPVTDGPNSCWSDIRKGTYRTDKHWTIEGGQISWQPGTGFAQNLGTLSVKRDTTVTFTALP